MYAWLTEMGMVSGSSRVLPVLRPPRSDRSDPTRRTRPLSDTSSVAPSA